MEIQEKQNIVRKGSSEKKTNKYICNLCNFNTINKSDYARHLLTRKHSLKLRNESDKSDNYKRDSDKSDSDKSDSDKSDSDKSDSDKSDNYKSDNYKSDNNSDIYNNIDNERCCTKQNLPKTEFGDNTCFNFKSILDLFTLKK